MKQKNFLKTFAFFAFVLFVGNSFSQVTLVSNGFEGGDTWAVSSGTPTSNSAAGASDTPANVRIKSGTKSWLINNGTETVEFASQTITGKTGVKILIYLSSTAGTSGNGADGGDYVRAWANVDGAGFPATADIEITGNSNARWDYAATLKATTAAGTNISNGAPQSGTNANNYATLEITIPNGSTSVALKIEGKNNSGNELWNIDDITLVADGTDPTVGFDAATGGVTETNVDIVTAGIPISFTNYTTDVTITPTVNGSSTAEAGDYTIDLTPIVFNANETNNIPLTIKADADSDNETIVIDFTVTSGTATLGTSTHTFTITDDETPPVPTAGTVFITEVSDAAASGNEYIEIYNNTNESVSLNTSKLVMLSSGGTVQTIWDINIDIGVGVASIPARGFLIITRGGTQAAFEGIHGALSANTIFIQGTSAMYFGTGTARRWRLYTGGTESNADGTLIDDTDSGVGGDNRHYQNIFTDTYVSDSEASATPGALEYLVYSSGAWVNGVAMDGTTGAKDVYLYDDFTVSADAEANNIGSVDNKGITINAGKNLTINGNLTLMGTNSFVEVSSTVPSAGVINSGSVILKGTYTSGGSNQFTYFTETFHDNTSGWSLVSSPTVGEKVDGNTGNGNFAVFNALQKNASNYGISIYDNSQAVAANRWDYYTLAEVDVAVAVVDMVSGKGYSIFPNSALNANTAKGKVGFKGAIPTTDVSITLTDGTGTTGNLFNFIGNPYPSFLPFNTTANATNLLTANTGVLNEETIWLWDKATSAYITVNQTTTVGGGANQRASLYIAPAQGFFVKTKTGGGSFTFSEAIQEKQASGVFNRNTSTRPEINLSITDNTVSKNTLIYYYDGKTTGFDNGYDSSMFGGFGKTSFGIYTQLVSNTEDRNLAIQTLPTSDYESMVIPVGVNAASGKELTFSAKTLNLPTGIKVFLEDRLTNTFTRLDEANSNYKVTLTETLNGVGRFYLYTSESALSVDDVVLNSVSIFKTGATTIKIAGLPQGKTSFSLFNILGKEMMTTSFTTNGSKEISLSKLATGVYIAKVQTEKGTISKKLILE